MERTKRAQRDRMIENVKLESLAVYKRRKGQRRRKRRRDTRKGI